jgi:hypothetical protein
MIPTAAVFVSCINLQTTLLYKQVYSLLSVTFTIIAVDSSYTNMCPIYKQMCTTVDTVLSHLKSIKQ